MSGQHPAYNTVAIPGSGEITEKKSRFIGDILPVSSEKEVQEHIASIKKRYYDARHHCYAFSIGPGCELVRSSDDGEPSGTAGRPIMSVLTGAGLTDTLIVVTRYFGGTLLGAGGLVRAYTQAAQEALKAAKVVRAEWCTDLEVTVDYSLVTPVQRFFELNAIALDGSVYDDKAHFSIHIITDDIEKVSASLVSLTEGRAVIDRGGEGYRR
ncbi:MAG: YigZ family protein [Lachnospiraceae bacterium]|nr:YigZ family protein [Lachnospiraceae bacterium]